MTLPNRLAQYGSLFAAAGAAHGVDGLLLAAVCDRESEGGLALRPHGPSGTGDWTARKGRWLRIPGVLSVTDLPEGWEPPRANGLPLPPPYAIPEDELGWGRGLMQLDYANAKNTDWRDAQANIFAGAAVLAQCIADFPRALSSAVAAYNCGPENVRKSLLMGLGPDGYTTRRNYSADVLARRAAFAKESP